MDQFQEQFRRHADRLYNFAYRLAGNEPDARDLVQEAAARALGAWSSFDKTRAFESWLMKMIQNLYIDGQRRYERRHAVSLDAPVPAEEASWEALLAASEAGADAPLLEAETDALVQKALDSLPPHYRAAVILSDIEGLPYERIAEALDCPVGTVRSRIHQGRALMRRAFASLRRGEAHGRA